MRSRFPALAALAVLAAACTVGTPSTPAAMPDPTAGRSADTTASDAPASPATSLSAGPSAPSAPSALDSDPLHGLVLTDVRNGEELHLGQLAAEKPVLLETMAIWCTNCRAQMHRVVEAHKQADFHSVGLDVDPSERPEDLKLYAAREGFDWPFAMADPQIADLVRDRLGQGFMFPPNTPMVLLTPDGEVRPLDLGGYGVEELLAEIGA